MNKTQHRTNNSVLGAPTGWNQNELSCNALPVTRCTISGIHVVKSYWRPTKEELRALNDGALVALSVVGTTQPPIAIDVERE